MRRDRYRPIARPLPGHQFVRELPWEMRHAQREVSAKRNRRKIEDWCRERGVYLKVDEHCRKWTFSHFRLYAEWWPLKGRLVFNSQHTEAIHALYWNQLLAELESHFAGKTDIRVHHKLRHGPRKLDGTASDVVTNAAQIAAVAEDSVSDKIMTEDNQLPALTPTPVYWDVGNYEYHQDRTCNSNSSLSRFDENPWRYYNERILGMNFKRSRSSAMAMGTALHCLVLEPGKWSEQIAVLDVGPTSKAWKDWAAENPEFTIITQDEHERVKGMREAIMAHPEARGMIEHTYQREHAVRWLDSRGVGLKVMFDGLEPEADILDLKTSDDPGYENFRKSLWKYRYDRQAALYVTARDLYLPDLSAELIAKNSLGFRWIVVGNEPPHECYVYELGKQTYEIGLASINDIITRLADAQAFIDQPEMWHGKGYGEVLVADAPDYILREYERKQQPEPDESEMFDSYQGV